MRRSVLPLLALVAGCGGPYDTLSPSGPAARRLADLGWPLLVFFTATSAVMWGILLWVALRRTGTLAEHESPKAGGGARWVVIGGFVVPGIAFAAAFVATLATMNSFPVDHSHDQPGHGPADIRVVGHQWWWEVQYPKAPLNNFFVTANEIHIPAGRPVDLELISFDVIHSLWAPRLHGKVDLIPGMRNFIRLQADKPGIYPGACAEFCGLQHAHMLFKVMADAPDDYERWLAHQRSKAAPPASAEERRGQQIFLKGPCVLCHTVRGTDARGTVGPDLTHVAGRSTIAGFLPRDLANLHAWVVNAPSLKPGTQMPALNQFSGEELHDLVAYLQSLK
jgi:cytochrome c oxidase subunit II